MTTPIQPCLPFGIGYKYRLSKNLNLAAEFVARKTFTDYLDGASTASNKNLLQRGFRYTSDLYSYFGISLSYTIYEIECPFDYNGF